MKRSELEAHTSASLIAALKAAGCTGLSRAKKDELVTAAQKLRGGARERLLAVLERGGETARPAAPGTAKRITAKPKPKPPVSPSAEAEKPLPPKEAAVEPVPTPLGEAKGRKFEVDRNGRARGVPEPGDFPLPDSYGIDLFHVLVFDPNSAYVFWELSPELLATLAAKHRSKWDERRLCVRALARDGSFVQQELYGDRGSYYLELGFAGQRAVVSLGFIVDGGFEQAAPPRTIQFPRDRESEDAPVRLMRLEPGQTLKEGSPVTPEEAFGKPLEGLGEEHREWRPDDASSSSKPRGGEGGDD
jgi:hypothetical protein